MGERIPTVIDGRVTENLQAAVAGALARRGLSLTASAAPSTDPDRYSEQTMTPAETRDWIIEQGLKVMETTVAVGEFALDKLPPLHKYTAEWVQQLLTEDDPAPWLVLAGPVGCGKTSQSLAAVRALILAHARRLKRLEWRFISHRNFAAKVQRGSLEDAEEVLKRYAHVPGLLVFSDLGDFNPQDFGRAVDFTSRLINHRYHERLPTIYETNLLYRRDDAVVALEHELGHPIATMDQLLDDRVIDRLQAGWTAPLPEINYRRQQGRVMRG